MVPVEPAGLEEQPPLLATEQDGTTSIRGEQGTYLRLPSLASVMFDGSRSQRFTDMGASFGLLLAIRPASP